MLFEEKLYLKLKNDLPYAAERCKINQRKIVFQPGLLQLLGSRGRGNGRAGIGTRARPAKMLHHHRNNTGMRNGICGVATRHQTTSQNRHAPYKTTEKQSAIKNTKKKKKNHEKFITKSVGVSTEK